MLRRKPEGTLAIDVPKPHRNHLRELEREGKIICRNFLWTLN